MENNKDDDTTRQPQKLLSCNKRLNKPFKQVKTSKPGCSLSVKIADIINFLAISLISQDGNISLRHLK